jgi:hypothetical protein
MEFETSYALEVGPICPSFELYSATSAKQYLDLLNTATNERQFQDFFECNPCFMPGAHSPGSHGPLHEALISQPELSGLRSRRPDFMWINAHSATWFPTLIEIESPAKRIFRNGAVPSHEFTQARNQLAQWRVWFSEPTNIQKFILDYGIPEKYTKFRTMKPHFILIYGRRDEFENSVELSKQRSVLLNGDDEELVSFDRLAPDRELREAVTVRAVGNGRYRVLKVMPTITTGPVVAERLSALDEIDDAIAIEDRISQKRRDFLIKRLPYWRRWVQQARRGAVRLSDTE